MNKSQTDRNLNKKSIIFLKSFAGQLKDGIIDNNPILIQLLGTCPTLATSTSVINAVGMGLATTAVLICSNLLISLLRRIIPEQVRIAAYVIVISGFVSAVELIIKAFFPALDRSLGVFIPLIVVNCIILARAEMFASKNKPLPSAIDGLSMGLGFMLGLILLSSIREILGSGTFVGYALFGENYQPALLFVMPPGAFITLGCLIAFIQKLRTLQNKKTPVKEAEIGSESESSESFEISEMSAHKTDDGKADNDRDIADKPDDTPSEEKTEVAEIQPESDKNAVINEKPEDGDVNMENDVGGDSQ